MAKFFYRMQNILDIKYKLEEQAKQEYMAVRVRLNEAMAQLDELKLRKNTYMDMYMQLVSQKLDVLEIEECKNAILLMDEYIYNQEQVVQKIERELEIAAQKMNVAMQERKIHEKLKENQFEEFLQELNQEEMKEIDQLVSYQYNNKDEQEEV
ncbi:MAG: flagellar export protein FliJ [Lachnospiraceae bacterium]|nr:flagellar export protein FliJ [Lachnospiraceae bacterium]